MRDRYEKRPLIRLSVQSPPPRGRLKPSLQILAGLLIILAVVLDDTLMPLLTLLGVFPHLISYCIFFPALSMRPARAALLAGGIGLLLDLLSGKMIGGNLLSYAAAAVLVAWLARHLKSDNLLSPLLLVFCGCLLAGAGYLLISQITPARLPLQLLWQLVLPEAIYTALLAPLFYIPYYLFYLQKRELRRQ